MEKEVITFLGRSVGGLGLKVGLGQKGEVMGFRLEIFEKIGGKILIKVEFVISILIRFKF